MTSPSRERDSLGTSFSAGSGHSFWLEKAYLIRSMNQIHPPMTYVQSNSFSQSLSSARPNSSQSYHEDVLSVPFHDWTVRTHDRDDKQLPCCVSCEQGQTTRDEERWLEWSVLWFAYCLYVFLQTNFFFIFATAGKATIDSVLHHYIVFLAFTTICANPFIYGLNNADYRQRCRRVLFSIMSQTARGGHQCCSEGNKSWACKIRITCPGRKKYNRHAVNLDCY